MRQPLILFTPGAIAWVFLLLAGAPVLARAADPAPPAEPPAKAPVERSTFDEKLKTGRDPFFPNSTRRQGAPTPTPGNPAPVAPAAPKLILKGISGQPGKFLALINNQVFAVGDTASVKTASGPAKIRVTAITESSATVVVEGDPQPKELRLRQ